ncbi:hypothetical protein DMB65_17850 [Flavobacterium cheongpyeongense]|uniref:OmpA-like domain-containing protein n=1 Tax=Flavobacterium cheongpyeongense TaxID=2212651 RepID=A0A2V4BNY3_9FLAO|nr:OmpA family protein [Flavobacterium cheongpyeongense]PXY39350.1 hypothetical protein DMB65_17850 [Flavobacterium cheongpyeongense]
MADIKDFKEGANILQNVDVGNIFTSLALGIAEAQEKLDNNSVAQIIKLSEQKIGDKSLLELGFVPAFYAFTEANINASISLKMAMKESLDVNVKLNASYTNDNSLTKDQAEFINSNKFSKGYNENKSSKSITLKASETNKVKIENESIAIKQEEGCVKMIEKFEDKVLENEKISEVLHEIHSEQTIENKSKKLNVSVVNGYVCISQPHIVSTDYGVLKITDYATDLEIKLDGGNTNKFNVITDLSTTLPVANTANTGIVYGFSKDGTYWELDGAVWKQTKLEIFFKHDDERDVTNKAIRLGDRLYFDEDVRTAGDVNTSVVKNNSSLLAILKKLNTVLGLTSETVTIVGETDSSGKDAYNEKLGMRRAMAFKTLLTKLGCNPTSIGETKAKAGGDDVKNATNRRASITLPADYIVFEGGKIKTTATPEINAIKKNKFIVLKETAFFVSGDKTIRYGQTAINFTTEDSLTNVETDLKSKSNTYLFENRHEVLHLLHKESLLKFSVFTKDASQIKIEKEEQRDENHDIKEDSILINEVFNQESASKRDVSNSDTGSTVAIGGSVDVRYARQFEMSMEGNASMSAKMVALPPPEGFTQFILKSLEE